MELIKKVIEHKNDNRIEAKDEYQSEVYEKLSMSLDDFNPNLEKNKFLKKFKFIKNYLDTSEFNGKPILTISVRETISDQYYRKHPKAEKTITKPSASRVSTRPWTMEAPSPPTLRRYSRASISLTTISISC